MALQPSGTPAAPTSTLDSIVMTGHSGPEMTVGDMLVTVSGVQKRLADHLAAVAAPGSSPTFASLILSSVPAAVTDAGAKAAGVPLGGLYRLGNNLMVRLV